MTTNQTSPYTLHRHKNFPHETVTDTDTPSKHSHKWQTATPAKCDWRINTTLCLKNRHKNLSKSDAWRIIQSSNTLMNSMCRFQWIRPYCWPSYKDTSCHKTVKESSIQTKPLYSDWLFALLVPPVTAPLSCWPPHADYDRQVVPSTWQSQNYKQQPLLHGFPASSSSLCTLDLLHDDSRVFRSKWFHLIHASWCWQKLDCHLPNPASSWKYVPPTMAFTAPHVPVAAGVAWKSFPETALTLVLMITLFWSLGV